MSVRERKIEHCEQKGNGKLIVKKPGTPDEKNVTYQYSRYLLCTQTKRAIILFLKFN